MINNANTPAIFTHYQEKGSKEYIKIFTDIIENRIINNILEAKNEKN